jgi:hypothetical protein
MITIRRKLLFNIDRFENAEVEVTITGLPDDVDPEKASEMLDAAMAGELYRVRLATSKDKDDNNTSLYTWNDIVGNPEEDANA